MNDNATDMLADAHPPLRPAPYNIYDQLWPAPLTEPPNFFIKDTATKPIRMQFSGALAARTLTITPELVVSLDNAGFKDVAEYFRGTLSRAAVSKHAVYEEVNPVWRGGA